MSSVDAKKKRSFRLALIDGSGCVVDSWKIGGEEGYDLSKAFARDHLLDQIQSRIDRAKDRARLLSFSK